MSIVADVKTDINAIQLVNFNRLFNNVHSLIIYMSNSGVISP